MLKKIYIEQFVIIDKLDLEFRPGLTVLTGETGAGKSILLDALGIVLGDGASRSAVRHGAEKAVIEATFAPPPENPVWKLLAGKGIDAKDAFTVRCVIKSAGGMETGIGGKAVDPEFLKKAGECLAEIHGQFANQNLFDAGNQLRLLDLWSDIPPELFKSVADSLRNYYACIKEQEDEGEFYRKNVSQVGALEERAQKIQSLGLLEDDFESLRTEYNRLTTAHETSEAFQEIASQLMASNGAVRCLTAAIMALERQKNIDAESVADLSASLNAALENARAAHEEVKRLEPEYNIDTSPLRQYRDKMQKIEKLAVEYKIPVSELSQYGRDLFTAVERVRNAVERIKELDGLIHQAEQDYRRHAHALTEKRQIAAEAMGKEITALLPPLRLPNSQFQIMVEEIPFKESWTEKGFNKVTFMARMNPGQPFSPIVETASGGELARLVLAVKAVFQRAQKIPTL
ncbi:MAG: AAA family ATPase, partial [Alphaproteobacteria bacterium]|nr:AAA family ATPase [Alphaproteobacteria bacterium]